jgi:hypothetical protein
MSCGNKPFGQRLSEATRSDETDLHATTFSRMLPIRLPRRLTYRTLNVDATLRTGVHSFGIVSAYELCNKTVTVARERWAHPIHSETGDSATFEYEGR